MRKENNAKKLESFLKKYRIPSFFGIPSLPFELYSAARHEVINNELEFTDHLVFFVAGAIAITHIRDDGTSFTIGELTEFTVLGDMEFASSVTSPDLVVALKKSWFVVLPLRDIRQQLMNGPVFLRNMLASISRKFILFSTAMTVSGSLRTRLLYHMQVTRSDHMIHSVIRTCSLLQCSKRQLLRILKQLCEEGVVEKNGKGSYRLLRMEKEAF
jgi:CRP-like cAMP-binding protein